MERSEILTHLFLSSRESCLNNMRLKWESAVEYRVMEIGAGQSDDEDYDSNIFFPSDVIHFLNFSFI